MSPELSSFTSLWLHQACPPGCPPPPGCPQANDSAHDEDKKHEDDVDKHDAVGADNDEDERKEGEVVYLLPPCQELFFQRGLLVRHHHPIKSLPDSGISCMLSHNSCPKREGGVKQPDHLSRIRIKDQAALVHCSTPSLCIWVVRQMIMTGDRNPNINTAIT